MGTHTYPATPEQIREIKLLAEDSISAEDGGKRVGVSKEAFQYHAKDVVRREKQPLTTSKIGELLGGFGR